MRTEEDVELRGRKRFDQVLVGLTRKLEALVKHLMTCQDDGKSPETARSPSLMSE